MKGVMNKESVKNDYGHIHIQNGIDLAITLHVCYTEHEERKKILLL